MPPSEPQPLSPPPTQSPAHYADERKIDPTTPRRRPDGTPDDNDRVEIGPTALAFAEWAEAGIECPDLAAMRRHRWGRLVDEIRMQELDGLLLFDPLNIRYATDTTNMQLWAAHNPFRACFVGADGHMTLFEYDAMDYLSGFNPLVSEVREDASFFYFATGSRTEESARRFAGEMRALLSAHGGGGRRLAVDKIQIAGLRALDAAGVRVEEGEPLTEKVRSIKGPDEIKAMRCAVDACERSLEVMHAAAQPGASEADVWSHLHRENIRRGGEWIETRILSSGPRTNPWFQECGPRVMAAGEMLSYDTDLIGVYGVCVDISRSILIGDGDATPEQRRLFAVALEQIQANTERLRPGLTFKELSMGGPPIPEEFRVQAYGAKFHGVGLCDEWPSIKQPWAWEAKGYDGVLEPGMVLCVEAYIGAVGGLEGVKLEDQVLITETGHENLTTFPFDPRLAP